MSPITKINFAVCLLFYSLLAVANGLPGPFEANYSVQFKGAKIAHMKRSFTQLEDGNYFYTSLTKTTGLAALFYKDRIIEESIWNLDGNQIKPMHYNYHRSGGKKLRKVEIHFDWESGQISTTVNGDSWKMPTQENILDKLLYQLAIMNDLFNGKQDILYTVADGGKIKTYNFEFLGKEIIKTPLGDLQTMKLVRHKPNQRGKTTFWCAEKLRYLPVKVENIEKEGRKTVVMIESLSGIEH